MSNADDNLHKNHRSRLKNRFITEGLDGFEDHNVLEMLLFYSIPRCDTNGIAHELLREFGSVSSVFDADIEALAGVPGVGRESALLIKFIPALWQRYNTDLVSNQMFIRSTQEAVRYLRANFIGRDNEQMIAVMLDGRGTIKHSVLLDEGSKDYVNLNVDKLIREILNAKAMGVVVAHSHPHGFAMPSLNDAESTQVLIRVLAEQRVSLCDHIIFSKDDYFAFSEKSVFGIPTSVFSFGK